MTEHEQIFTYNEMAYLKEMMNIAAGNAAVALGQVLSTRVTLKIPRVNIVQASETFSILGESTLQVACARMRMVGDVVGHLFFLVPDVNVRDLVLMMEEAAPGYAERRSREYEKQVSDEGGRQKFDYSVFAEMSNILAGVYLATIHDFSRLNIYHSPPRIKDDMIKPLLDEAVSDLSRESHDLILIENIFIVGEKEIKTFLLIIPSVKYAEKLGQSIKDAWGRMMDQ